MRALDFAAIAQRDRHLQHVTQLPDVARPVIRVDELADVGRERTRRESIVAADLVAHVLGVGGASLTLAARLDLPLTRVIAHNVRYEHKRAPFHVPMAELARAIDDLVAPAAASGPVMPSGGAIHPTSAARLPSSTRLCPVAQCAASASVIATRSDEPGKSARSARKVSHWPSTGTDGCTG